MARAVIRIISTSVAKVKRVQRQKHAKYGRFPNQCGPSNRRCVCRRNSPATGRANGRTCAGAQVGARCVQTPAPECQVRAQFRAQPSTAAANSPAEQPGHLGRFRSAGRSGTESKCRPSAESSDRGAPTWRPWRPASVKTQPAIATGKGVRIATDAAAPRSTAGSCQFAGHRRGTPRCRAFSGKSHSGHTVDVSVSAWQPARETERGHLQQSVAVSDRTGAPDVSAWGFCTQREAPALAQSGGAHRAAQA